MLFIPKVQKRDKQYIISQLKI